MTLSLAAGAGIWRLPLALLLVSAAAQAQTGKSPADHATASRLTYRPALENYQAYAAQPVRPWRESNDAVGQSGARHADGKKIDSGGTGPAPAAGSDPHAGHREGKP